MSDKDSNQNIARAILSCGLNQYSFFSIAGKFTAEYAQAETAARIFARSLSGMPIAKAKIIFDGMRLGDVAERIRRLMRYENVESGNYDDIDACLTQLDKISTQRNNLVHCCFVYAEKARATNPQTATRIEGIEVDKISFEYFEIMTLDCLAITARIKSVANGKLKAMFSRELLELIYLPWRYIPTPQTQKKKSA
jgi:hypothetical protein